MNRRAYWAFMQEYGRGIDENTLRQQKTVTVRFSSANNLTDALRFKQAVTDAAAYVKELHPSSISAAVRAKQEELEAKDKRVRVQVNFIGGAQHVVVQAKEEIPLTLKLKTFGAKENLKEFFEKGTDVRIKMGEFELSGSPLFEDVNTTVGGELVIKSGNQHDGQVVLSWEGMDAAPPLILPGHFRAGLKFVSFDSDVVDSPLALSFSFGADTVKTAAPFRANFMFRLSAWEGQRILALPYFDATHSFLKASTENRTLKLELWIKGNRLGSATMSRNDVGTMHEKLPFVDSLRKAQRIFQHFHLNPVLPSIRDMSVRDFATIEELFAMLYENEHRSRAPKASLRLTVSRQPRQQDVESPPGSLLINAPTVTYPVFGHSITTGPVSIEYTKMTLRSWSPTGSGADVLFEATDSCERVAQLGKP